MATFEEITRHGDLAPDIEWVGRPLPLEPIAVVDPDPQWATQFDALARTASAARRYAEAKRKSAVASNALGEDVFAYNQRKHPVIREIIDRMFRFHGMADAPPTRLSVERRRS